LSLNCRDLSSALVSIFIIDPEGITVQFNLNDMGFQAMICDTNTIPPPLALEWSK
jgi:hypothetical protein